MVKTYCPSPFIMAGFESQAREGARLPSILLNPMGEHVRETCRLRRTDTRVEKGTAIGRPIPRPSFHYLIGMPDYLTKSATQRCYVVCACQINSRFAERSAIAQVFM